MQPSPTKNAPAAPNTNLPANHNNSDSPKADAYLGGVSRKYRLAKYITIVILVVFLLLSLTFMRKDITLENLQYLLKFISFTNTETSITAAKINYASGDPNRLELFIGDLCTLSPSGYALYDSRGNQIMSERINYAAPVLKVSEYFTLCYDLNGAEYTILNTYTKLHDGTSEYPITDGTIADNGSFAIASSSREYRTAITIYDSDFKAISRILKNDHLMALEYKPDASVLAVMTTLAENGSFNTNIELIVPGADKVSASSSIDGLGYSLYFMDGTIAVVTDESIHLFDESLSLLKTIPHKADIALTHSAGKYLCAVYSSGVIGNSYTARIFDTTGRTVFEGEFSGKLVAADSDESGDYIFLLTGNELSRINLASGKIGSIPVENDAIDILVSDAQTVLVAKTNCAMTYGLSQLEENYFDRSFERNES